MTVREGLYQIPIIGTIPKKKRKETSGDCNEDFVVIDRVQNLCAPDILLIQHYEGKLMSVEFPKSILQWSLTIGADQQALASISEIK